MTSHTTPHLGFPHQPGAAPDEPELTAEDVDVAPVELEAKPVAEAKTARAADKPKPKKPHA